MTIIFKTVKGLLFAYSTAVLLVIVAVIQSDQSRYDKALDSLRDTRILSASFDRDIARTLINVDIEDFDKPRKSTFSIPQIQQSIEFSYPESSVDFDTIPKAFVGIPPSGFDFGRSQVESFPTNFTKLEFVNSIARPMLKPTTLQRYIELHNASLNPVTYTQMSPDFTGSGRLEAYGVERRTFNTSENLQLLENGEDLVVDGLKLAKDGIVVEAARQCNLIPKRTSLNNNLVYFCDLGILEIGDKRHAGVRLTIPATVSLRSIPTGKIANVLGIPKNRSADFDVAHPELAQLSEPYRFLTFDNLKTVLETERDRTPSTVSLFGAVINLELVVKFILSFLAIFFGYLSLHIREAVRISGESTSEEKSTWLPTYPGIENLSLVTLQLFVMPAVVTWVFIQWGAVQQGPLVWVSFTAQLLVAIWCFVEIIRLRTAMN